MTVYEVIKSTHVVTAILSISGFILRGVWMMKSSSALHNLWVNVLPHINDTILLVSAVILSVMSAQYPGSSDWLNAKIIALIVYILLGIVALKRGPTLKIRIVAWCMAILVFTYILAVANSKTVWAINGI